MFLDDAMRESFRAMEQRRKRMPAALLERAIEELPVPSSFRDAIARNGGYIRVIAEVKRRSPSAGEIRPGASVSGLVREYEGAGASAVSVLTSAFFDGSLDDLAEAHLACTLPVLRKDFISDEYQLLEARADGASAVLLISEALTPERLMLLLEATRSLGMDALVECHAEAGMSAAVEAGAGVIGINNRDLTTLDVDVETTERLLPLAPADSVVVSESGIRNREQVRRLQEAGVDAMLVGEELMRARHPGTRLAELLGRPDAHDARG